MMKKILSLIFSVLLTLIAFAQQPSHNKGTFKTYEPGYFQNTILKGIEAYDASKDIPKAKATFKADASDFDIPNNKETFKQYWHNEPVSQGNTNTCWSFSTTSYLESEVLRITGNKVRISEMYTVYCEYLERAHAFVQSHGNIYFGEGSEANAVTKIWKKYGCLPYESYTGFLPGQTFYAHDKMFEELKNYTEFIKKNSIWDESAVISNFKSILNHYMGEPPLNVTVNGSDYNPVEYLRSILRINPDDYCDVLSYMQKPYWNQVEYEVPDNWWHNADYYNIPLDDFMNVLKTALKKGYTVAIGGDVSEPGFLAREANAAVVPDFDIPSAAINENSRQFRFSNETTTDDHGMHVVGYMEKNGVTWFLVKDSGSGSRTGGKEKNPNFGYYFFHEDYVKLKMMDFMVHKDMMKDLLPKFKKQEVK
ncbi:MAG: peptidase C1 [Bacteroidetes bacterium]|nr:peptidase C1 [Bacteroidota bacterium]